MEPTVITGIVLTVVAVISLFITILVYKLNRSDHVDDKLHSVIKQVASEANEPISHSINDHTVRLTQYGDRLNRIEELLKDNATDMKELSEVLSKMGVKVDMYWTTLESLAMNAAKGLHQPDPARNRIDYLLEAFMEGTLTGDEHTELKKCLVQIRNYESGSPALEFPVYPGEQTFAAILLSTIDLVDPRRIASMGHAAHRATRDKENI